MVFFVRANKAGIITAFAPIRSAAEAQPASLLSTYSGFALEH
jgi:hypothetical protein